MGLDGVRHDDAAMLQAKAAIDNNQAEFNATLTKLRKDIADELGIGNEGQIYEAFQRFFMIEIEPRLRRDYDSIGNTGNVVNKINNIMNETTDYLKSLMGK